MANRPGKKALNVDLPDELDSQFRKFVEDFELGTLAQHVEFAIRRHIAHPPVLTSPPYPDERMPPEAKPRPKR